MVASVFQLKDPAMCDYAFRNYAVAKKSLSPRDYCRSCRWLVDNNVYNAFGVEAVLEDLFRSTNVGEARKYLKHSLSVSDIVVLEEDSGLYAGTYYCDDFGWEQIKNGDIETYFVSWGENEL